MSEVFTPEVSDRICQHMNEDHSDAIVLYARAFGGATTATAAKMLKIDATGMDLLVQQQDTSHPLRISFDHVLQDAEDAHHTLIAMVKQARSKQ
jgi:putative heme iron utilization protein